MLLLVYKFKYMPAQKGCVFIPISIEEELHFIQASPECINKVFFSILGF